MLTEGASDKMSDAISKREIIIAFSALIVNSKFFRQLRKRRPPRRCDGTTPPSAEISGFLKNDYNVGV